MTNYDSLTNIIEEYKRAMLTEDKDLSGVSADLNALTGAITFDKDADAMYTKSAQSLLNAVIYYLLEKCYMAGTLDELSIHTVKSFFTEHCETFTDDSGKQISKLDELFKTLPAGHLAKTAYAPLSFSTGDTRSSIFATLSYDLDLWTDEGIDCMTSGDDINCSPTVKLTKKTTKVTRNYPGATVNEISIDCADLSFLTIYGTHINGGYVAFPEYGVSAELSTEDDGYNDFKIFAALKSSYASELPKSSEALKAIATDLAAIITPLL